jgi:hypothetical protein
MLQEGTGGRTDQPTEAMYQGGREPLQGGGKLPGEPPEVGGFPAAVEGRDRRM